jgi:hypothetical protein
MTINFSTTKNTLFHEVTIKLFNIIQSTKYNVGINRNLRKNIINTSKYVRETLFDINKVLYHIYRGMRNNFVRYYYYYYY